MAYSYLSLPSPRRGRLNRAASSVLNPLSRQTASPTPTPDYGAQLAQFMGSAGMAAPDYFSSGGAPAGVAAGAQMAPVSAASAAGANPSGFNFSNANNSAAFSGVDMPSLGAAQFAGQSVDYANDPILQQVQAMVNSQIEQARAATIAAEKTALIRYGSGDIARQVLGDSADSGTVDAANNNAFGTVQELGRWNDRALGGINSATNRNNLFFSSTRLRDRALQQEDLTRRSASTAGQLQDILTGQVQNLLGIRQGAQQTLLSAAADAYGRALAQAQYQAQLAAMMQQQQTGGPGGPTAPTGPASWGSILNAPWWQQSENPATAYRVNRNA